MPNNGWLRAIFVLVLGQAMLLGPARFERDGL
jgi:hypothetical protein